LALSAEAYGAGRGRIAQATPPTWLEFRTAFAAEDLWPQQAAKLKSGSKGKVAAAGDPNTTSLHQSQDSGFDRSFQNALVKLREWSGIAGQILDRSPATFDVARN
jgi:hypothetical protein